MFYVVLVCIIARINTFDVLLDQPLLIYRINNGEYALEYACRVDIDLGLKCPLSTVQAVSTLIGVIRYKCEMIIINTESGLRVVLMEMHSLSKACVQGMPVTMAGRIASQNLEI